MVRVIHDYTESHEESHKRHCVPLTLLVCCAYAVPNEQTVVNRERMSGAYRLSAYYLAKGFSQLPLTLIQPTFSFIIYYSMAELNGFHSFASLVGSWLTMLLTSIAAQSLGECSFMLLGKQEFDFWWFQVCMKSYCSVKTSKNGVRVLA